MHLCSVIKVYSAQGSPEGWSDSGAEKQIIILVGCVMLFLQLQSLCCRYCWTRHSFSIVLACAASAGSTQLQHRCLTPVMTHQQCKSQQHHFCKSAREQPSRLFPHHRKCTDVATASSSTSVAPSLSVLHKCFRHAVQSASCSG